MSPLQLLSIIRARWAVIVGFLALAVSIAIAAALILPKQYESGAAVVLDVKSPDPINGIVLPGMMSPGYMATQIDIIESERVALKVIEKLSLANNPTLRAQWYEVTKGVGSFESWLAGVLLKSMRVLPSRESNVIQVFYKGADPEFSAAIANAFVRAYIETTVELRTEPAKQYSSLFEAQSKILREKLEAAQGALSDYQQKNGLLATDERLDVENARLNELSSQLVMLQAQSSDSRNRQAQISANSAEVLANPVVAGLKADVSRSEARLQEMSTKYGPGHPVLEEIKASIAELRLKIDAETKRVVSSVGINTVVNAAREREVKAALEQQREKLLKMKETRDSATVLLRDVESAQRAYETMQARINQTALESQSNQANVSILKMAQPSPVPSSPNLILYSLAAVFLGTFGGLVSAIGLELHARKIRLKEDLVVNLGLNLLGQMPNSTSDDSDELLGKRQGLLSLGSKPTLALPSR